MALSDTKLEELFGGKFDEICRLAEDMTGLKLDELDPEYLAHRLSTKPEAECALKELLALLDRPQDQSLRMEEVINKLVESLAVGTTNFFRHPEQFQWLSEEGLPNLRQKFEHLWLLSVGSSTGEETWSLAMVAAECLQEKYYKIFSYEPIKKLKIVGMKAIYPLTQSNEIDKLYYKFIIIEEQFMKMGETLQKSVEFLSKPPLDRKFHLVMARNWLYYLRQHKAKKWAERLLEMVVPGGYLIVAPQEVGYLLGLDLEEIRGVRGAFRRIEEYF